MTLTQLEYIIAIADHGSFVEAAEHSFVTQPALTTQVKNLEQELEVILFDRTRKPIIPTEVGQQIIEQARNVVWEARKIPDLVNEYQTDIKGDLTIGIIPTIAPYLIPLFINAFNQRHPKVNVNVREEITEEIITQLKNGTLDVGILATPVQAKNVIFRTLYYERFFGYVSENHPTFYKDALSEEDLVLADLWLLKEGNCFRNQVINICSETRDPDFQDHFRYESHSIESLKRIVDAKSGMTLIPELSVRDVPRNKREMIKEIPAVNPFREVSLVIGRQYLKKRLIDGLHETITEAVPASMLHQPDGLIVDTNLKV